MERFAGRYRLVRPLGQGGMGSVWLALDLSNGSECVLKRLDSTVLRAAPDALRREFELLARVRHPAVVRVGELGVTPEGTPYLTMEYVPGVSADRADVRWDTEALCVVAADVAHGLEALHAAGVVHGDLKPSNLLLPPPAAGERLPAGVRLVDFGLGSLLGRDREGHRGTPGFAAPEVVRGAPPDERSDLYGLGATLYALAGRRVAPEGPGELKALRRRQRSAPPAAALEEAGLAEPLVQLVLRLMAPDPAGRPSDAREVRRELERIHPAARRSLDERLQAESLAGRERELARLERLLQPGAAGPRVVVLAGEAGVGKSALLSELAVRATLAGRSVVRLACASLDAPGASGAALLRRLAAEAGAEAHARGESKRALELLERGDAAALAPEVALLADAAAGWFAALLARGRAPLVLMDDCERLDPLSRAIARAAALHTASARVRWVWAGRTPRAAADEGERVLVDAGQAVALTLGVLEPAGAERLVERRLAAAPPAGLCDFLWARSGGHPGLLVETLRAAAAAAALRDTDAGLVVDAGALATLALPKEFEVTLLERLGRLSDDARAAAGALAAWNRPAGAADVAALDPRAGEAALAALVAAELASRDEHGAYALRPPELARRLLAGLDPERRRGLHQAVLARPGLPAAERFVHREALGDVAGALAAAREALAAHADARLAVRAAALADAGAAGEGATWHAEAGRLLHDHGRHRDAVPHLERALELERDPAARAACWVLLTTALLRADRPEDVEHAVTRALAEDPAPRERALLVVNHASQWFSRGRLDAAETAAREALALAESAGADKVAGHASLTLGSVLNAAGRGDEADAAAVRAEQACRRAGHAPDVMRALGLRAALAAARRDAEAAAALYQQALELAHGPAHRLATEETLLGQAVFFVETGRWAEAGAALERALRLALEDGRPRGVAVAHANLALLDGLTGRTPRARRRARAALWLMCAYLPRLEPFAWRVRAMALRAAGRRAAAEHAARRAADGAARLGLASELEYARLEYGRQHAVAGRWSDAEAVWRLALAAAGAREGAAVTLLLAECGRAALRRRDEAEGAALLARCDRWLAGRTAPYAAAHAQLLRAELALAQGRGEEGKTHAERALAAFAALPAPADRAAAALDCARVAVSAGAPAPCDAWLEQAAAAFESLGDHRGRERALALAVEWLRGTRTAPSRERSRDLLRSVSRLLDSLSDLGVLTRRAMQLAVEQMDAERGVLLLADEKTGALVPVVEQGAVDAATRNQAVTYSRQAVERVATSGGSLLIPDVAAGATSRSESMLDLRLRSIVCVPLYGGGKVVGAVYLDDSRREEAFSDADRALLEGFAHLVAIAIQKSRGQEEERRTHERLVGENLSLRQEVGARFQPRNFVGMSSAMQKVLAVAERASQTATTVLITGENGTGKEMIARIVHHSGRRRLAPFVSVNCGAIPQTLLESELFGILPNVATGVRGRDGRFVEANGGTLFLDEIGDMPLTQQVALLSAISNREITPVGGGRPLSVDVRIIAATNQDLRRKVEEGSFREDLFYRLNVLPIEVPPLRERKADIPALAHYFAAHYASQQEREVPDLSPEFLAALMQSDWPGNVRELQNYVERVMAMTPGKVLLPHPLPRDLESRGGRARSARGRHWRDQLGEFERSLLLEALERADGNQSRAARELGMSEPTFRYRLRKHSAGARKNRRTRNN